MLLFCEECGSRNFIDGEKKPESFRCSTCGYTTVLIQKTVKGSTQQELRQFLGDEAVKVEEGGNPD